MMLVVVCAGESLPLLIRPCHCLFFRFPLDPFIAHSAFCSRPEEVLMRVSPSVFFRLQGLLVLLFFGKLFVSCFLWHARAQRVDRRFRSEAARGAGTAFLARGLVSTPNISVLREQY